MKKPTARVSPEIAQIVSDEMMAHPNMTTGELGTRFRLAKTTVHTALVQAGWTFDHSPHPHARGSGMSRGRWIAPRKLPLKPSGAAPEQQNGAARSAPPEPVVLPDPEVVPLEIPDTMREIGFESEDIAGVYHEIVQSRESVKQAMGEIVRLRGENQRLSKELLDQALLRDQLDGKDEEIRRLRSLSSDQARRIEDQAHKIEEYEKWRKHQEALKVQLSLGDLKQNRQELDALIKQKVG